MPCYFFSGRQYIRVDRNNIIPGVVDTGYPKLISVWGWPDGFVNPITGGIDAALNSGPVCYFFSGPNYIRVTRGRVGPGKVDPGYPKPITTWGWPDGFVNASGGIDAALNSGPVCYFFSGPNYIRMTRGNRGPGTVDPGYPKPITVWGWPNGFVNASGGIDAAMQSGPLDYFFSGSSYIAVARGDRGPGQPGPIQPISQWGWGDLGSDGIDDALFSGEDFPTADELPV